MIDWPESTLDPVARLRVLAAALPDCHLEECVIDAPFEAVWGIAGDLEGGVPRLEQLHSVRILERRGAELDLLVRGRLATRFRFRSVLRPGFCLMESRFSKVGMAAVALPGERTLFAHFEGIPLLGRFLRPLLRASIRGDFRRLAALAGSTR